MLKFWCERWGNEVIVVEFEDRIEIFFRKKFRFLRFFDIFEVELKGEDIEKEFFKDINF